MKKQIFTLLALLLTVCSGAWADAVTIGLTQSLTDSPSKTMGDPTYTGTTHVTVESAFGSQAQAYSGSKTYNGYSASNFFRKNEKASSYSGNCWIGFKITVASGYKMSLTNLKALVWAENTAITWKAEIVNSSSSVLYSSAGGNCNTSDYSSTHSVNVAAPTGVSNLSAGIYYVRINMYQNGGNKYLSIPYLTVDATIEENASTYTVTFNAGSNGTCGTASLTEASAGAGVTLPEVTPNSGYVFNGWYTAASEGTKVGDSGSNYKPAANATLYAQYSVQSAPAISIDKNNPSTKRGLAVTFTATTTGAPVPTVTWYQSATAVTTGGTEKGTGATFNPDVATEGTYYYYAVASNGVSPDATSELITLTVTNPDVNRTGYNTYYVAQNETAVGGERVFCDNITMVYDNVTYNKASGDNSINELNSNYVASIGSSTNNWGVTFTPTVNGVLSVGLIANGGKTITVTNVSSFDYEDKDGNSGTSSGTTFSPANKLYGIVTFNVVSGKTYKVSVTGGTKMSIYGFEFNPTNATITPAKTYTTYVTPAALDFTGLELKAYVATAATTSAVTMVPVTTVPANTPLVLKKGSAASYDVPVIASAAAPATNKLVASDGVSSIGGDGVYDYILSNGMFYHASAGVLPAGKAYLHLDSAPAGARELSMSFEDEATGISEATLLNDNGKMINDNCFDLQGRKVAQPTKGLYIVNGKKVVIK